MSASDLITMRDGTVLPVPVLRRLWAIEAGGVRFERDGDDVLIGPSSLLTDETRAFVRANKVMILTILSMQVTA